MNWFAIPEGYSCVTRQNDTQLYGYVGNQRHTFVINGLKWEHTSTQTNTTTPQNAVCVTSPQVPSSVVPSLILAGCAIAICFFSLINKIMKRSYL